MAVVGLIVLIIPLRLGYEMTLDPTVSEFRPRFSFIASLATTADDESAFSASAAALAAMDTNDKGRPRVNVFKDDAPVPGAVEPARRHLRTIEILRKRSTRHGQAKLSALASKLSQLSRQRVLEKEALADTATQGNAVASSSDDHRAGAEAGPEVPYYLYAQYERPDSHPRSGGGSLKPAAAPVTAVVKSLTLVTDTSTRRTALHEAAARCHAVDVRLVTPICVLSQVIGRG